MRRVLVPLHVPDIAPLALRAAQVVSLGGETMGTMWSVKIAARAGFAEREIKPIIERQLALVVAQMSQWEPGSDLSRFNHAPAGTWHALPGAFFHVLAHALAFARDTGGVYDPTIGALTELWGFGAAGRRRDCPGETEIEHARAQTGSMRISIDHERKAALQSGGVRLDLASIAKGFAVDLVSEVLTRWGFTDHLVEIGGELRGQGTKPDRSPWWVALDGGDGAEGGIIVALYGLSIATSGDAQRFIAAGGRRFSHTIDPRTGWPVSDALASVSVFDRSCMRADALATALAVLGPEEGHAYATARGIAARFMSRGSAGVDERVTPAFEAMMGDQL